MKLREWLDKHSQDLGEIKVTLAKQEINLEHHVKRTDLLEESVDLLRKEGEPVKKHVYLMNSLAKITVALITIGGTIVALLRFLG